MTSAVGMKCGGDYKAHSDCQRSGMKVSAALQARAVEAMCASLRKAQASPLTLNFADFGSADGGNSMQAMSTAIRLAREAFPATPICITHTDLPKNDWSFLFESMKQSSSYHYVQDSDDSCATGGSASGSPSESKRASTAVTTPAQQASSSPASSPSSSPRASVDQQPCMRPGERIPNVFTFASGTSFHEQIFPSGTLHFGICGLAAHWTSSPPQLSHHLDFALSSDTKGVADFRARSATDWLNFLLARQNELVTGGRLVMHVPGRKTARDSHIIRQMHIWLEEILSEMQDKGVITAAEHAAFAYPIDFRDLDSLMVPFKPSVDKDGKTVAPAVDRLVVESAEPREVPCVYKTALKEHKDEQRFADDFMRFVHAFSEPLWQRAVADRPADEGKAIVANVSAGVRRAALRDLATSHTNITWVFFVVAKV